MSPHIHLNRVVVTGIGLITPLATSTQQTWSSILASKSGIKSITSLNLPHTQSLPSQVAGYIPKDTLQQKIESLGLERSVKNWSSFITLGVLAAEEALKDSGWEPRSEEDLCNTGVCVGSGIGSLEDITSTHETLKQSWRKVSPYFVPKILANMAAGNISIRHGFKGPISSPSTACATGSHAIGDAFRMIQHGDATVMLAGGTESSINALSISGFCKARSLSTAFNTHPESSSRPFDSQRDGFVISEGAGVLVLEEYNHAKRRGADIYAEIKGFGISSDGYHITAPSETGDGAYRAMKRALETSRVAFKELDYVNAHATSTVLGDLAENRAIKRLVVENGDKDHEPAVSSTKGALGHLLGAAGAVEAGLTVLAIRNNVLPPTLNLHELGPEFTLKNYVPLEAQDRVIRNALSNSFGFGGTNTSLCFGKL